MKKMKCMKGFVACLLMMVMSLGLNAQTFEGHASYYADYFHGRNTASGERFHRDSLTCAHLKLPFGTLLKVVNTRNNKEVIVKVTDRGPYSKRYTLDLSPAAARQLDMMRSGHVKVEITNIGMYEAGQSVKKMNEELLQISPEERNVPYLFAGRKPEPPSLKTSFTPPPAFNYPEWMTDSLRTKIIAQAIQQPEDN